MATWGRSSTSPIARAVQPPPQEPEPYVPPDYRQPRRVEPEPRLAPDYAWEKEAPQPEPAIPRYAPTPAARRRRQAGADQGWPAQGKP